MEPSITGAARRIAAGPSALRPGGPPRPAALDRDLETRARRLVAQERVAEAVELVLEHGLDELAAELLACGSVDLVRSAGDYEVFFGLVDRLGTERVRRWPQLDAAAVWALTLRNRLRLATVRLDELEARIPQLRAEGRSFVVELQRTPFDRTDPDTAMPCWVGMMRSLLVAFAGEAERALQLSAEWRKAFPRSPDYEVATVHCASAHGYQLTGRWAEAERDGRAALTIFCNDRIEYGIAWSASGLAYTLIKQGRVGEAEAALGDARQRVAKGLDRATHADLPLQLIDSFVRFERGDFASVMGFTPAPMGDYPSPMLALGSLRVGVWMLLAMGRTAEALALVDGARYEGSAAARQWWDHEYAIERARTALVAGATDRRWYTGPASARDTLELLGNCRRSPSPLLLRGLRRRLQQAEERGDGCEFALLLVVKARIEQDIGQELLARRSITQLLTSALTAERVGTLASLAPGLQPMFNTVLLGLLQDGATEALRQLASLVGAHADSVNAAAPPRAVLSKRERQIAPLLFDALSNREIAERLHLTEPTVKWHLWNLFQKLGVRNRAGAVRALSGSGLEPFAHQRPA